MIARERRGGIGFMESRHLFAFSIPPLAEARQSRWISWGRSYSVIAVNENLNMKNYSARVCDMAESNLFQHDLTLEDECLHQDRSNLPNQEARPENMALSNRIDIRSDADWECQYHEPERSSPHLGAARGYHGGPYDRWGHSGFGRRIPQRCFAVGFS